MATTTADGVEISDAGAPLLNDVVRGSVDFKGRPSARRKSGRWKSASFIIGVELAQKVAFYGISSNLISYLTGSLGQSTATAAANVNTWNGASWLMPLVGAFMADSFVGRYRMILVASLLHILGLGLLSLSAAVNSSNSDCQNATNNPTACAPPQVEVIFFFFSLYLTAVSQAGIKPCVQTLGAEQFDQEDEQERKAKSSLFNWWNFVVCVCLLLVVANLNYVQDNLGWPLCFGILCIAMCIAVALFLLGTMTYRFRVVETDGTSQLVRICLVFVRAARNWRSTSKAVSVEEEVVPKILPCEGAQFKFLNKALLAHDGLEDDEEAYIYDDIESSKAILRLIPIWSACLVYAVVHSQVSTLFVKQAATMDRYITTTFQIPVASIMSCLGASMVAFIPIYDRILVPIARAITKKPTGISVLQRVGTGVFLSLSTMWIAALVEMKRLDTAVEYGLVDDPTETLPMSVWWLAPQYIVLGIADVFTLVGLQEFFYDQVPVELKSTGMALCLSIMGIGQLLSSFLIYVINKVTSDGGRGGWFTDNLNRAHLDYFYWLLSGLSVVAFAGYLYFARSYVYYRRIVV